MFLFLVWDCDDEQYCRQFSKYPELTRKIISKIDFIEAQCGSLSELDFDEYEVNFFFFLSPLSSIPGVFGCSWFEICGCQGQILPDIEHF